MVDEEACDIALGLGLGLSSNRRDQQQHQQQKAPVQLHILFPSHTKEEEVDDDDDEEEHKEHAREENGLRRLRLRSTADEEEDGDANNDGSNKRDGSRKKLRLSKEQSTLLEDSFRQHNTLNTTQKKELAERLSLKPRQVEVWFQNRRARTKLKQTEVDCEFLKKCCESLSDENRRLKKELQELRSIKPAARSPFYIQLAKAAKLTMCPSCERIVAAGGGGWKSGSGASSSTTTTTLEAMSMVAKPKFYNCTTAAKDSSSMACCK